MVRKIIQVGHQVLRNKNKQVKNFKPPKLNKLFKDLVDTMYKSNMIGIAAPQIAENLMIFATHPRNTKARKLPNTDKLRFYINPKIVFESKNKKLIYEGCGSIANGELFGPVKRSQEIEIEALDKNGKKFRLRCDGILARVIQHEMEHLMGKEFINRVEDYTKIIAIEYYRRDIRKSHLQKKNSRITIIEYKKL